MRRRDRALRGDVAEVCELLAVCLEAGRPTRGAARTVAEAMEGPTRDVLLAVLHQVDLGVAEPQAWASLGEAAGYRTIARDISRSVGSGVGLSVLLRQHAREARRGAEALALVEARKAGVRSIVPLVVCFLPAFFLLGVAPIFGGLVGR
ncbi:type II secretion system F family protein [Nigerium massiliense]|uniref:type II secretion system F family protein n=1 Tax=Nigerium massiliense TaxID=1522317 RepID=UPI000907963A|nr:type II secretion system F family protein [Nigerium massiliense]